MQQNFWEQGNLATVNFREGNMQPPFPGRLSKSSVSGARGGVCVSKGLDGKFVTSLETKHGAVYLCAVARWCNGGVLCRRRLFREDT